MESGRWRYGVGEVEVWSRGGRGMERENGMNNSC